MKRLAAFLFASMCAAGVSAQDNSFFPTEKGTELSYKYYDRRGKALKDEWRNVRWMKFTVEDVWPQEDGMVINVGIANEIIERLAKNRITELVAENLSYGDVKIVGDSVVWDNMQWVVAEVVPAIFSYISRDPINGPQYKAEITALTAFPRAMTAGDALPDENILDIKYAEALTEEQMVERKKRMEEVREELRVMFSGPPPSTFDTSPSIDVRANTRNRKVDAVEQVETPAGTFDCYKISYEVVVPSTRDTYSINIVDGIMSAEANTPPASVYKYADWISPKVGLVKREKYNEKGKLQEVMILDSVTK